MNIERRFTPNWWYRGGYKPCMVVMHIAEGSLDACDAWFADSESNASAHYCVGKDGEIHQYVAEELAAWANGVVRDPRATLPYPDAAVNPNLYTISIEHEGMTGEAWTDAMYEADAWLLRGINERWGIPLDREHVIGHCDIDSVDRANCPGSGLVWEKLIEYAGRKRLLAIGS
jgi:N-acetylmuramoyl-L-alanine amidase